MRLLTETELLLVCGAGSSSDPPIPPNNEPDGPDILVNGHPPYSPGPSGPGAGGSTGGTAAGDDSKNHQEPSPADPNVDCKAQSILDQIKGKLDSKYMEYQGRIYVTPDGIVHTSNILPNGPSGGATAPHYTAADWGIPSDGFIIGIVHNHPEFTLQNPSTGAIEPSANPRVAELPSYGDMSILRDLQRDTIAYQGSVPFQAGDIRMYVGFGDKVSEYAAKDQDFNKLNVPNTGNVNWGIKAVFQPACKN